MSPLPRALQVEAAFRSAVERGANKDARAQLELALPSDAHAFDRPTYFRALAGAGRHFGETPIAFNDAERATFHAGGVSVSEAWTVADAARVVLVVGGARQVSAEGAVGLVTEIYRKGDNPERCAVLRSLCAMPEAARFVDVAVDACRSHVEQVFEAIASRNAYPAAFFSESQLNQMVMKALFVGVPLAHVEGLSARVNDNLVRMARDYAAERRAAHRVVPNDITLISSSLAAELEPSS